MAVIYPMPTNVPELVSTGYQRQNTLVYAAMAGHLNLSLTNLDNASAPKVQAGSVFEVNGGLFYVSVGTDETISGSPATGQNYVYAVPNTGGATFQYSATKPVWSAAKGGWYNGNNRAVAKVYYIGGQYNNKVALDRQAAMYEINEVQSVPTSGGALVVTGVVNEVKSITLEPGRYRFEIKAGTGGNGGSADSNKGGNGGEGQSMNVPVVILKPTLIYYGLGGNGNNGEDSFGVIGKRYPGGGGGGCSGGSAFINIEGYYYFCLGGGGGGDGSNSGSSGSSNSGGYGGYTWGASKGGFGGIGGGSSNAEQFILNDINNRMKIQYQGGGGGGDGGDGGSGLKNTSSGYLRIYQLA